MTDIVLFFAKLQVCFNIFYVFILPVLTGIVVRKLLGRHRYAWVLTAVFGILAAALVIWVQTTHQHGYEGPSLLAVQLSLMALSSFALGLFFRSTK